MLPMWFFSQNDKYYVGSLLVKTVFSDTVEFKRNNSQYSKSLSLKVSLNKRGGVGKFKAILV